MAIAIRGKRDKYLNQIAKALHGYQAQHPAADIVLFRQNSASVDIRVIDPGFKGMARADRHDQVWTFLAALDESTLWHLTILLLLTPDEAGKSTLNLPFEAPARSRS